MTARQDVHVHVHHRRGVLFWLLLGWWVMPLYLAAVVTYWLSVGWVVKLVKAIRARRAGAR